MKDLAKTNQIVTQAPRILAADSLHKINDIITGGFKKWDTFDLDVEESMLDAVKRVVKARDLEWRYMEYPEDGEGEVFVFDGVATIVIGVKGSDFKSYEGDR